MKNKYIWLIVLLLSLTVNKKVIAQSENKKDSLESLLPYAKESQLVDIYVSLAEILRKQDVVKTRTYAEQALTLANKLGYDKGLAGANIILGQLERDKGDYKNSKIHYLFGLSLALKSKDLVTIAWAYQNMGNLYYIQSDYSKAMRYYLGALSSGEKAGDILRIANANMQIGSLYFDLNDTLKAEFYFTKAYEYNKKLGDEVATAKSINNLGNISKYKGDGYRALFYYSQAIDVFKRHNLEREISAVLNNIGAIYAISFKNPRKAFPYYAESYQIDKRLGIINDLALSSYNLSAVYIKLNMYDSALFYGLQALKLAKENNYRIEYVDACHLLSSVYEKKGDTEKAFYYMKESQEKAVLNAAKGAEVENIHSSYYKAKQNETIKKLNVENNTAKQTLSEQKVSVQRKNVILLGLVFIILFLVLLGVLVFYFLYQNKKRKSLELTSAAKSNILNRINHELRTPLNSLINYSYLANESKNINELRDYLGGIRASGNELLFSMNNIVSYMQIDSKSDEAVDSPFNLMEMLQSIFIPFDSMCKQKGLFFTQLISADLPTHVISDKIKVATIVQNLLSNAFNASYQGVIKIEIKLIDTKVTQHETYATIQLQVSDEGRGLQGKNLKELAMPFIKNDNIGKGFGLGLFIVKKFVEKLVGKFELTANPNVGATATVTFDVLIDTAKTNTGQPAKPSKAPENINILIVEDDEVNSFTLQKILERKGFDVATASYGKMAMSKLSEKTFDIVLIDIELPDMTGIELARYIRQGDEFSLDKEVPVILLSANAEPKEMKESLHAGINEYMTKPISKDLLISKIMEFAG